MKGQGLPKTKNFIPTVENWNWSHSANCKTFGIFRYVEIANITKWYSNQKWKYELNINGKVWEKKGEKKKTGMCEWKEWKKNIFQVLPSQFAAVSTYLVISVPLQSGAQGNRVSDLGVWSWLCMLFLTAGKRRVVSDHMQPWPPPSPWCRFV